MTPQGRFGAFLLTLPFNFGAVAQPCSPSAETGLQWRDLDGEIRCMAVFDGGQGESIYFGGHFTLPDGTSTPLLVWNGVQFVPATLSLQGTATHMVVWDVDGPAWPEPPVLYIAGSLRSPPAFPTDRERLIGFNGSTWWHRAELSFGQRVTAMGLHNEGQGERLYLGVEDASTSPWMAALASYAHNGPLQLLGTITSASHVAPHISSLASFQEPEGRTLFIGGQFVSVNGQPATGIIRYRGGQWLPMPAGQQLAATYGNPYVSSFVTADVAGGPGPRLYASGSFNSAGAQAANGIAMWDGQQWAAVGDNTVTSVGTLFATDVGQGVSLYGFRYDQGLARWDGAEWTVIGEGLYGASLARLTTSAGPVICAAGQQVRRAGEVALPGVGVYNGSEWRPLGGLGNGFNGPVQRFFKGDLGDGERLYAVGDFSHAGGTFTGPVAVWGVDGWQRVGGGLPMVINAKDLAVFDDGSGRKLWMTGSPFGRLFRLDGDHWTDLAWPASGLVVFDPDGDGPQAEALFGIGSYYLDPQTALPFQRWNGTQWEQVPIPGLRGVSRSFSAAVFDPDGAGPRHSNLYLSGHFVGDRLGFIMRWDGETWFMMDTPPSTCDPRDVHCSASALAVHDDGEGPALYAVGPFSSSLALKLHADAWLPYGPPGQRYDTWSDRVASLQSVRLPTGSALVSTIQSYFGRPSPEIISDNAIEPFAFTAGLVYTVAEVNDDAGPAVFLGGEMLGVNGGGMGGSSGYTRSSNFAIARLCRSSCTADFNGDGEAGTDADIEAFFACLAGRCCERCGAVDFNNDGDHGTDQDIESFFRVLSGAAC